MSYKIPKNGPAAWYLERYGYGIGAGSPGVDDAWAKYLLQESPLVIEPLVVYQPFPLYPLLFLIFLVIFILMPAGWII